MCYIKKTISVRIVVVCLINSSRHRQCFVRGYIHSLFVSKAITRSYLARSSLDTINLEHNRVRRTFYDVNYIYSYFIYKSSGTSTKFLGKATAWESNCLSKRSFHWTAKRSLLFFSKSLRQGVKASPESG